MTTRERRPRTMTTTTTEQELGEQNMNNLSISGTRRTRRNLLQQSKMSIVSHVITKRYVYIGTTVCVSHLSMLDARRDGTGSGPGSTHHLVGAYTVQRHASICIQWV